VSDALPTQQDLEGIPEFGPDGKPNDEYMERFAAWAFIGVPGLGNAVMNMIGMIAKAWSKHLYKCGFRFHPELQQIKRQRPYRGQQHALNGIHAWVPVDSDEPEPITIQDPMSLTVHEREAQVERLRYMGYKINEPDREDPKAQVIDTLDDHARFDPSEHTAMEVISYLHELGDTDEVETRRVIFRERSDRKRNNILKRHPDIM
jgi:hypothetical protein